MNCWCQNSYCSTLRHLPTKWPHTVSQPDSRWGQGKGRWKWHELCTSREDHGCIEVFGGNCVYPRVSLATANLTPANRPIIHVHVELSGRLCSCTPFFLNIINEAHQNLRKQAQSTSHSHWRINRGSGAPDLAAGCWCSSKAAAHKSYMLTTERGCVQALLSLEKRGLQHAHMDVRGTADSGPRILGEC